MANVDTNNSKVNERIPSVEPAVFMPPGSRLPKQEPPYSVMAGGSYIYPKNWHSVTDYSHIIPSYPGCYAIYKFNIKTLKSQLIYIGTAQNLKLRLAKHEIRKCLNALLEYPEITLIKCRIMLNDDYRKRTEIRLITKLKPKGNYV
jgi:predicted GIY-YIG superfamily endonuclease